MSLVKPQTLTELQTSCEALGSTAKVCALAELLVRASSPEALEIEECVGAIRRLPLAWCDPSRWVTIVEGNFKFKEAIYMKEGRAALMGFRRAGGYGWTRPSFS